MKNGFSVGRTHDLSILGVHVHDYYIGVIKEGTGKLLGVAAQETRLFRPYVLVAMEILTMCRGSLLTPLFVSISA